MSETAEAPSPTTPPPAQPRRRRRTAVIGGIGVLGIAAGAVFGVQAASGSTTAAPAAHRDSVPVTWTDGAGAVHTDPVTLTTGPAD